MSTSLFNEIHLPTEILVPDGIKLRALRNTDFGYLKLLEQLTSVGNVNEIGFQKRFQAMRRANSYFIIVLEHEASRKIVGAATLLIEFKFIHSAGTRGRVEDVVVDDMMRGKKLGALLNQALVEMARKLGVYKLSLECKTELLPFYQKFGYSKMLHFLDQRFPEDQNLTKIDSSNVPSRSLFNENLLPNDVELPENLRLRGLRTDDFEYLEILKQLTSVGNVSKYDFEQRFSTMKKADSYFIAVLENVKSGKIVGAATLVTELKYIHEAGLRGRVEDVVVDESMRGKKLGILLNRVLVELAEKLGIYKLSLECKTELIPFYEKFGYKENIHFMVQRFESIAPVITID